MDRILIILKKENGTRASSAPALGLNTIIFKRVYWYMQHISGERLQDHWSSGYYQGVDGFQVNTGESKEYQPVPFSIKDRTSILFQVKACGHVYVLLMADSSTENDSVYEVIIGKIYLA